MFNLIKQFKKRGTDNLSLSPILFNGNPIFFPEQVEEVLGYSNLSDSLRKSEGFIKDIDYIIFKNKELSSLKTLLHRRSNIPSVSTINDDNLSTVTINGNNINIADNVNAKTMLTESGVYALAFRSNKPEAVDFRIWVTSVVLPGIRRHVAKMSSIAPTSNFNKCSSELRNLIANYRAVGMSKRIATMQALIVFSERHDVDAQEYFQMPQEVIDRAKTLKDLERNELEDIMLRVKAMFDWACANTQAPGETRWVIKDRSDFIEFFVFATNGRKLLEEFNITHDCLKILRKSGHLCLTEENRLQKSVKFAGHPRRSYAFKIPNEFRYVDGAKFAQKESNRLVQQRCF